MTAVKAISSSLCEASRRTEEKREAITWDDDYRDRVNPALVTELLRDAVPVLRYVGWKVTETAQGCARTILPLCEASTNQHGTHQAALVALAADYTGGIALATLLRGIPILGVHPQPSDNGASLWLVSLHVTYRIPSTGDLLVSVSRASPPGALVSLNLYQSTSSGLSMVKPLNCTLFSIGPSAGAGLSWLSINRNALFSSFLKTRK